MLTCLRRDSHLKTLFVVSFYFAWNWVFHHNIIIFIVSDNTPILINFHPETLLIIFLHNPPLLTPPQFKPISGVIHLPFFLLGIVSNKISIFIFVERRLVLLENNLVTGFWIHSMDNTCLLVYCYEISVLVVFSMNSIFTDFDTISIFVISCDISIVVLFYYVTELI